MFGDRLYKNIIMGLNAGVTTYCELSGEMTIEMIEKSKYKSYFIINGIWELLDQLI